MPSGRCSCASVSYVVDGPLRDVVNCHCDRCRRITGHFMAATAAAVADMSITDTGASLTWYEPTDEVGYGFCRTCGSTLFWRSADRADVWSISAGTLDQPTGLTTTRALFVAEAGDYHRLDHDLIEVQYDGGTPPGV
jgi:hypothetical protein